MSLIKEGYTLNMNNWLQGQVKLQQKRALPLLSFPGIQLMDGVELRRLVADSDLQSRCMQLVAQNADTAAAVSFMDLSVEAEAFGCQIVFSDDDVPAVVGALISDPDEAEDLAVPAVGAGRTGMCVESIRKAKALITDRPVFAGVIGPFSLPGRLVDVSEAMVYCYEEPEMLHTLLEKCTEFSIGYIKALKEAGANGVVMAEPLAGLISPSHEEEFSAPYVKKIVEAVQDEEFIVIYHNCGNYINLMTESFANNGCKAFHFGNSVEMSVMLDKMPQDVLVMGNIDPAAQFRNGTPESMTAAVTELLDRCAAYTNFIPSSGCDTPPQCPWNNIHAFFNTVKTYYQKGNH